MFSEDLKLGQKYEKIAIELLGAGETEKCPENVAFSDWDFQHNGVKYEVKSDRRAASTGNLVFEYEHTDKPSGISITKADVWMYFVIKSDEAYVCYKIPIGEIHRAIHTGKYKKSSCDNGNSKFYLIPASVFNAYKFGVQVSFR
jgi:hypothetical protein